MRLKPTRRVADVLAKRLAGQLFPAHLTVTVGVFVRSDAEQLSQLVGLVDAGELRVDVAERVPLPELEALHARAAAGELSGKAVVVVETD